jgi:hypothetical protein
MEALLAARKHIKCSTRGEEGLPPKGIL